MGQGTDSCGGDGYDFYSEDEDIAEERLISSLEQEVWTQRNGVRIHIHQMTLEHLRNAGWHCRKITPYMPERYADIYREYAELFDTEIARRTVVKKEPKKVRGSKVELKCSCGTIYLARESDVKRGWGKYCSKSCAKTKFMV